MRPRINYLAIVTFYVIAIALRYLTNKTHLLDGLTNYFLRIVLRAAGPAAGALLACVLFKIKPVLSLKGNYKNIALPFLLYWGLPIALITGAEFFTKGTIPVVTVFAILVYGLLEEIGWRGSYSKSLKDFPNSSLC